MSAAEGQSEEKSDFTTAGKRQLCQEEKKSWSVFSTPVNCAALGAQESCEQSTVVLMWPEWGGGTCAGQKAFEALCMRVCASSQ